MESVKLLAGAALVATSMLAVGMTAAQESQPSALSRVADRLRQLQREADDLATQEKSILNELRRLELQRQMKAAEVEALEQDLKGAEAELAAAESRTTALQERASGALPDVEARLVRLYKMGRAGYWRLLFSTDDTQSVGRAYRLAATMMQDDRQKLAAHGTTLRELEAQRGTLKARAERARSLRDSAAAARAALDRAVASRSALVASIDERRDLAAQLTSELQAAQRRLQAAATAPGASPAAQVPLRPFRGDIPWPADGFVTGRFGSANTDLRGVQVQRQGIELSLAEGRPVRAIHDGTVILTGPFSGYGRVVIVAHGDGAQSLYGHLASTIVNKGDHVTAGTQLGLSGRNPAGNPSLYFELQIDGKPVDPLQWLRKGP